MNEATRRVVAGALFAAAMVFAVAERSPSPAPPAPQELDLRGAFVGPSASDDAATVACLSREIADEIEHDGKGQTPYMKAAINFDMLRTRARDLRCRGRQLGETHPEARDRIATYLDKAVGNSGGPVDVAARAAWVRAYRVIGDAADAAR